MSRCAYQLSNDDDSVVLVPVASHHTSWSSKLLSEKLEHVFVRYLVVTGCKTERYNLVASTFAFMLPLLLEDSRILRFLIICPLQPFCSLSEPFDRQVYQLSVLDWCSIGAVLLVTSLAVSFDIFRHKSH